MPASFDVFVSYPHKDQTSVRALAAAPELEFPDGVPSATSEYRQ